MRQVSSSSILGAGDIFFNAFWAFWEYLYGLIWRKGCALYIGRFAPPHKGHINVILWLLSLYEHLVIGIGSCYEVGSKRHPLLAVHREKMLLASLTQANVDLGRITIVHIPDYVDNFDAWWNDVMSVVKLYRITHFVTGNEEQILRPLKEKGIGVPFFLVNPEKELPKRYSLPYHATELREAIMRGDYEMYLRIASAGTIALGRFTEISQAMNGTATQFIPGRQAVDLIITCNGLGADDYHVICGIRKSSKENFPGWMAIPGGGIGNLESPLDAVVREGREETGLEIKIVNRTLEPSNVIVAGRYIAEMRFVKLFSTNNPKLGGREGGSSQLFHIHLDVAADEIELLLKSESDLRDVKPRQIREMLQKGLAYQQTEMLLMVAVQLGIFP
jgi:cytidyltransferase-like protein